MDCSTCLGTCDKSKVKELKDDELPLIVGGFLNITQKCNLACKYCFVIQQPMEMTYEVAKDAADFYAKNAEVTGDVPSINFFGGEPLLRWNDIIVPLTEYIRETYPRYNLSMTSNGVLLTRKKMEFMKKHNIGLLFSIDGDKETQDKNRPFHNGKGSFDSIKDIIPLVLEYYPGATFRATVDNDNVYDMVDNYKFAVKMGYNNVFMIPNIFAKWTKSEEEELKNQLHELADIYMDLLREGKVVEFSGFRDSFKDIKKINNTAINGNYRMSKSKVPAFGRCGLGGTKFGSIGASGNIYSCQELTESPTIGDKFCIGNIYDGVDDTKRWEIMKNFNPVDVHRSDGESCKDCLLDSICTGYCSINNYLANDNLNVMPSILCTYYQEALNQSIRIMNKMAEEKNEVFKRIFGGG